MVDAKGSALAGCTERGGARRPGKHRAGQPERPRRGNNSAVSQEGLDRLDFVERVSDEDRDTYLLWREPKAPDFVLEVTSKSTRRNDQVTKHTLYESLGVAEYFLYDPRAEYLNPPLQGFGLHRGRYVPLEAARLPDGAPALYSEALGLSLHVRGQTLRLHDPATGEDVLTLEEEATARGEAEARAERETADRRAVEAENARLRARIRELERSARASGSPQSR